MSIDNVSKAVLVTGCSTGIGRATAQRLAAGGWTVYATARRPESIEDLVARGCRLLRIDVCDEPSMQHAVEVVEAEEGAVGVLVNNAGYGLEGPVEEVPLDELRRQFETNLFGPTRLTQLVLAGMRRQGWGKVVNVSSVGGRITIPGGGAYHASKHALEALSDALRFEVHGFGIDVILIEPGAIRSSWVDTAVTSMRRPRDPKSPYAAFDDAVANRLRGAYEGLLA
ncbi:MAG TPA: SDR family NAD(P)-dependent oxidoreductase, partial [Acidimicrobiales bacterium]|nr:SDR family NAD(P)-dependent oxidoreductase [Acidimicrobiales bacterium]